MGQMINAFKYFKGYHVKNGIDLLYMAIEDKKRKNVWKLHIKILCNIGGKLLTEPLTVEKITL